MINKLTELESTIKAFDEKEKEGDTSMEIHLTEETEKNLTHCRQATSESLYNKSYSRTWLKTNIVEYIWEINRAMTVFKTQKEFFSAMFPETFLYRIKLTNNIDTSEVMKSTLRFYLLTETNFEGTCDVCIVDPLSFHKIVCKSISGLISNMTLLYETTLESLQNYIINDSLVMYFEIEFIHKFVTKSIHIDMMPSSTTLNKQLNSEISMLVNFKTVDEGLITFNVKGVYYIFPKRVLYATNSKYFKSICEESENKKGNTYEVEIDEMPVPFKKMLSFILSGLISEPFNYRMLKDLLIMAHKYDVQTLKSLCEFYLIRMINIQNSIELIQLACVYDANFLKKHTLLFIKLYLKEVVRIKEFQRLPQNDLEEIIKLVYSIN